MRRVKIVVAFALAASIGLGACSSPSDQALNESLEPMPRGAVSTTSAPVTIGPTTTTDSADACNPQASFAVQAGLPSPSVDKIVERGHLIVGVDQGTPGWGFRDPRTAKLKGLEVELLRRIASQMFGDGGADRIMFKTLNTAQRIAAVERGDVDLVASLLTATCERWKVVDFSSVYFLAHQALLVRKDSEITSVGDLAGRRVCATQGSTSIMHIAAIAPKAVLAPVEARSDCVVALEQGDVDAITSDDTILRSFQSQDKVVLTRLVELPEGQAEQEPYAIAITKKREDLVRFVNGVLAEMRADGSLRSLYPQIELDSGATVPEAQYR